MTYIIAEPCVDVLDKACVDECPVDCIYEGNRMLYIHPDECVDCGACEPVCPVEAIFYEDDVPSQWKDYYKVNVDFFTDLGSPGGASKVGKIDKDHAIVEALPPMGEGELTGPAAGLAAGSTTVRARPRRVSARLPDFPWDLLEPHAAIARAHPDGVVDLSVGTPVDPVPATVQLALRAASDTPGYPATYGTPALRQAAAAWLGRRGATVDPAAVLPTIGSKELVAWLPTLLGLGPGSTVVVPTLAYPTYEVGARLAGAEVVRADATSSIGPARVDLVWVNSPANPTGRVLGAAHLAKVVAFARERGAVVVSDECYLELGWSDDPARQPVSVLDDAVSGGNRAGVLAVHSLSKRSNLAGYRAGFVAGDPDLVRELLAVRKHAGMIVAEPVQAAMVAALSDDDHVAVQRQRYRGRRDTLLAALTGAGFRVDHSEAGLYLWATRGEDCWETVAALARLGILVAPGVFYGPAGQRHVRVAITATDERVGAAAARLA